MNKLKKIQIILFRNTSQPEFLLLKTSSKKSKSIWQGITGGVEETDMTIKKAALRELTEELNITSVEEKLFGPIYEFQFITDRQGYEGTTATEYCFWYELPHNFSVNLSEEHDEYRWLPFSKAYSLIDYDNPKRALQIVNERLTTEI